MRCFVGYNSCFFAKDGMHVDYEDLFMGKRKEYPSEKKMLEYIKVIRKLSNLHEITKDNEYSAARLFKRIGRMFDDNRITFDFEKLTLEELDDLLWFARTQNNKELYHKIQSLQLPVWDRYDKDYYFQREGLITAYHD